MNNSKCAGCGLVNFASAYDCKRCGAPLESAFAYAASGAAAPPAFEFEGAPEVAEGKGRRSLLRRALTVLGVSFALLVGWHASLLFTSTPATYDERRQVERAVELIERGGFTSEALLLRRLTNFRTTDNWLTRYVGHPEAYA